MGHLVLLLDRISRAAGQDHKISCVIRMTTPVGDIGFGLSIRVGFALVFCIIEKHHYRNAIAFSQGSLLDISPRLRWKLERMGSKLKGIFGGKQEQPRPKLCPACGTLVGATATRCHQCGASMTYSMAAASRSLARMMPTASPATYAILALSCLLYGISLLWTIRLSGSQAQGGGLFNLGGISADVLLRLGESLPLIRLQYRPTLAIRDGCFSPRQLAPHRSQHVVTHECGTSDRRAIWFGAVFVHLYSLRNWRLSAE